MKKYGKADGIKELITVEDWIKWRNDGKSKSVEDEFKSKTEKLKWERTDVLYSFLGIYALGMYVYNKDAFKATDYMIEDKNNNVYSKTYIEAHYKDKVYCELNKSPDLIKFLNNYITIGNVIPIWPGGNEDKGKSRCFDLPELYFSRYEYWFDCLKESYPNACLEDILKEYKFPRTTTELLRELGSSEDLKERVEKYNNYLKHINGVIAKRNNYLEKFLSQ